MTIRRRVITALIKDLMLSAKDLHKMSHSGFTSFSDYRRLSINDLENEFNHKFPVTSKIERDRPFSVKRDYADLPSFFCVSAQFAANLQDSQCNLHDATTTTRTRSGYLRRIQPICGKRLEFAGAVELPLFFRVMHFRIEIDLRHFERFVP